MSRLAHKSNHIRLKDRTPDDQPRERLWKHGAECLSTAELIAILVRTGTKGRSAIEVGQDVLDSNPDGVKALTRLTPLELSNIKGVGKAKSASILAALELARRATDAPGNATQLILQTIEDVADHFRRNYGADIPEKFVAYYINRRHRLLHEKEIARGSGNAVVVDPKMIFKQAVLCDASGIILAHNHPGGTLEISKQDHELTDRLLAAGKIFAIPVVEHVIVTAEGETGLLA
jgi:DNA repair protein RadC